MLRFLILLVLFSGQAYLLEMMCLPLEAAKFEGKHLKVRTYFLLKFSIRVCTGPAKPGKSRNFILKFSGNGKSWKKTTGPGKS